MSYAWQGTSAYWRQHQVGRALLEAGFALAYSPYRDAYILQHLATGAKVELDTNAIFHNAPSSHPRDIVAEIVRLAKQKLAAIQDERAAEEQRRQKQLAEARKAAPPAPRTDTVDAEVLWIEPPAG